MAVADPIKENKCDGKQDLPCVFEVFDAIFKTGSVTNHCCQELVNMGSVCHYAYVRKALEQPEFKTRDPADILNKARNVWNQCASVAPVPSA